MRKYLLILCLIGLTTGCAIPPDPEYYVQAKFDKKAAQKMLKPGNNTIKGEGFLRQRSGQVIKCSGYEVSLIPATDYASERMIQLYESDEKGYNPVINARRYNFIPDEKEYYDLGKTTVCNADGKFEFKNVADGTFYVITPVLWESFYEKYTRFEGGSLMQKVKVKNGETKEVIMTK